MNDSMPLNTDVIFDVDSLYARLGRLQDRRQAKGRRYSLALVLLLVVLAKLCGEDTPYGMAEWARYRCQPLLEMLGLQRQTMPCHNTYRRVLAEAVDLEALQQVTGRYLQEIATAEPNALVTIDGKTMRGTIPTGGSEGLHLLAAYRPDDGVVLMQVAVERKENEIAAAPRLVQALDLRGKVVRADALLTQRKLSQQILEAGGDYVWVVKGNNPGLLAEIQEVFAPPPSGSSWSHAPRDLRTARQANSGHGRHEQRELTASCFLNDYLEWPGVAQVFQLRRHVVTTATARTRQETVFGITSLPPTTATPKDLLHFMRGYWAIENGLHYRRDKTMSEDALRMRSHTQAQAIAIIHNLIVGLVKNLGFDNLAAARRYFNARLSVAVEILSSPNC